MKSLALPKKLLDKRNITDIVLDTTGLKICGEGEWRAQRYGGKKRWEKQHLAIDAESGKLILAKITDEYVHNTKHSEKALKKANNRKGKALIDGIADSGKCYELSKRYSKRLLTPTKRGAIIRKEPVYEERNN